MSFWRSVAAFFRPCVHAWEVLETMKDDPENPTTTTVVQRCPICGETRSETYRLEGERQKPHTHSWTTINTTRMIAEEKLESGELNTLGFKHSQTCSCGAVRTLIMGMSPRELKSWGYDPNKPPPNTVFG